MHAMQINFVDGRRVQIDTKTPTIDVRSVKEAIEEKEGIAIEVLSLLKGRSKLRDEAVVRRKDVGLSAHLLLHGGGADGERLSLPKDHPTNPRFWTRDHVREWVEFCAKKYDMNVDVGKFLMNGRALCLMKRSGFCYRVGNEKGDTLFGEFQRIVEASTAHVSP